MNSQKNLLKLFALVPILFLLFSCGNRMDRDKAKQLISQKFNLPSTVTEKLQHGKILYSGNFGGSNISAENSLAEQKMISFNYQGVEYGDAIFRGDRGYSYAVYYLELTPEGQKYKTGETTDDKGRQFYLVKVADQVLVDVTGILESNDGKAAQVEYTWKYENITPFGEAFSLRNQQLNQSDQWMSNRKVYNDGQTFSNTVMMVKYDDGWRIQQ